MIYLLLLGLLGELQRDVDDPATQEEHARLATDRRYMLEKMIPKPPEKDVLVDLAVVGRRERSAGEGVSHRRQVEPHAREDDERGQQRAVGGHRDENGRRLEAVELDLADAENALRLVMQLVLLEHLEERTDKLTTQITVEPVMSHHSSRFLERPFSMARIVTH